jgi:hypothetical protein
MDTDKTPYKLWMGCNHDLSHLKKFGYTAYALMQIDHRKKLDSYYNLSPHPRFSNPP